jgi:alpha-galactosidase
MAETMAENSKEKIFAAALSGAAGAKGFPEKSDWARARPIRFSADWRGKSVDPDRETEVRMLWTPAVLHLRFRCRYREITVFPDAAPDGRRDHLWDRDVAEVFLQPSGFETNCYQEFEVSPNGFWIDLAIAPGEMRDLRSGLRRRTFIDTAARIWTAEMWLPMQSLTNRFDPASVWRLNFFRVEGAAEPRFYSAWRPTNTPEPNFHVPAAFGELRFAPTPGSRA